jgi:hypothetical protein
VGRGGENEAGAGLSATTQVKHPAELKNLEFDFGAKIGHPETITGTPTVVCSPTGLTIGAVTVAGTRLEFTASGGTDGVTYRLTATASTTAAQVLIAMGDLVVTSQVLGWRPPA